MFQAEYQKKTTESAQRGVESRLLRIVSIFSVKKFVELTGKIYRGNIAWQDSVHGRAHHLTAQTKQFLGRIGTDNFCTQEPFLCVPDLSIYNIATVSVNLTVNFKTGLMSLSFGTSTLLLGLLYVLGHPRRGHTVCHSPRDKRRMFVQKFTETRTVSTDCVSGARDSWKR